MNVNLNDFDVVVIETVGDVNTTTCFKNYSDYRKDKEVDFSAVDSDLPTVNMGVVDGKLRFTP